MALPEQVRRMSERANELLTQETGGTGEPTTAPAPASVPQEPAPAEPAPEPNPAPAEPTPAPAPPVDTTDWAQKYRTLQGVFNAEQGRWNAEKKVLESRLAALEAQATKPAPAPASAPTQLVTDKDLETYGPELLDVIKRQATEMAEQIVAAKLGELKPELERTQAEVTQVKSQVYATKEDKFFGELAKACPEYETINTDPRFGEWLAVVDDLSGEARQVFLDKAAQNLDHVRVAKLFNAFKASVTPAAAPAPSKPTPSPSPRTVGNASAPAPHEPVTGVKRSEIAAHYARAGREPGYRDGTAYKSMEERIATAMASGNIIEA